MCAICHPYTEQVRGVKKRNVLEATFVGGRHGNNKTHVVTKFHPHAC